MRVKEAKYVLIMLLIIALVAVGCGKKKDTGEVYGDGYHITSDGVIEVDDEKKEKDARIAKEALGIELSGEYVVDYQLGEEPIPLEIADLGNPCVGTIHAYPSKIDAALSEMMMTEDKVKKEQANYIIGKVDAFLKDEGVNNLEYRSIRLHGDSLWYLDYIDTTSGELIEFYYPSISEEMWDVSNYTMFYDGPIRIKLRTRELHHKAEECENEIKKQNTSCLVNAEYYDDSVCIVIWEFRDEVNRVNEQDNIAKYWNEIQRVLLDVDVNLQIVYIPHEYKPICKKKVQSHQFEDYCIGNSVDKYIQNGEILDFFWYDTMRRELYIEGRRKIGEESIRNYSMDINDCIKNPQNEWNYWD